MQANANGPQMVINGNGGNDTFVIGGGNIGPSISSLTAVGGAGVDRLVLDDHLSTHSTFPWYVYGITGDPNTNNIVNLALNAYSYNGFEEVEVRAGAGNNTIHVVGAMSANVFVNGGDGGDAFLLEHVSNYQDYDESGQGGSPEFHYTLDIDGGSGFNLLTVDDTLDFDRSYSIWPDRMLIDEGAPLGLDFDYDSFQDVTVLSPPNPLQFTPQFHIFGTSSDIPVTNQMTILGSSQTDEFVVHPHDAQGNLTINGNLGIVGGGGFDTLVVDDTGSSSPINYSFYNQFGPNTTSIGGLGAANFGALSDIENITINAGGAADTFFINSFKSGSGLGIYGGGGNDVANFGVTNLTSEITNMAFFKFDGQGGSDTLNINNTAHPNAFTYTRNSGAIAMSNALGAAYGTTDSGVETVQFNAGPQGDTFLVNAVASGEQVILNAGSGLDGLGLGFITGSLETIRGLVVFNGGPGGGNLHALDSADISGDTVHQDQTSLGAYPGDNLFGPGGSLQFNNIVNAGGFAGVTVTLGSGADTIYAQPLPTGRVSIVANNPTSAPGDKLTLALAQAANPVVTGTTNGNVTSTNLQTLTWTGIETLATDATTPTVDIVDVTPDPRTSSVGSIAIDFSEAVTGFNLAHLSLTRNGGPNLLPVTATLTSGDQIHWTLGNLGGLTNISGAYLLTLTAAGSGIADLVGNALTVGATDSWTANIPELMGDANGDLVVNIFDVNLVSANWGTTGPAGDVNHDGMVDIFDINLISANWGAPGGGAGGGEGGGSGASVADEGASPSPTASSPPRIANSAADTKTDDRAASSRTTTAAVESTVHSGAGNLNAILANWGAGTVAPLVSDRRASQRATNPSAIDLLWQSNERRHDATHAVATESPRTLAPVALHAARATRHASVVDSVFRQAGLGDWDHDLLDDLLVRGMRV